MKIFSCLCCPECFETGSLYIEKDEDRRKGLASFLNILCGCGHRKELYTSKTVEKAGVNVCNKSMMSFEVNFRAVYGMRTIGGDHTRLEKLCGMLNMSKPMTVKNFNNISNVLHDAAKVVAGKSMNAAANELKNSNDGDILDISVSVDGSWQRHGFSSLNGVVDTLSIDNCKVVDVEPIGSVS